MGPLSLSMDSWRYRSSPLSELLVFRSNIDRLGLVIAPGEAALAAPLPKRVVPTDDAHKFDGELKNSVSCCTG